MGQNREDDGFWNDLENKIEKKASTLSTNNSKAVDILFSPLLSFFKSYFLRGNFLRGRKGYRAAIQEAVFVFSVNARYYELNHTDKTALETIKREWS